MRVLVLHGPNLDLLGEREPHLYGSETLLQLDARLGDLAEQLGVQLETFQSNHEGALIDRLHSARKVCDGIVFNPGGLSHTSVALRDAVAAVEIPVVEVHLTNLHHRESFRRRDLIAPVCRGVIMGLGVHGYLAALRALLDLEPVSRKDLSAKEDHSGQAGSSRS